MFRAICAILFVRTAKESHAICTVSSTAISFVHAIRVACMILAVRISLALLMLYVACSKNINFAIRLTDVTSLVSAVHGDPTFTSSSSLRYSCRLRSPSNLNNLCIPSSLFAIHTVFAFHDIDVIHVVLRLLRRLCIRCHGPLS